MIVVMKKGVTEQEIEGVLEHIQTAGFRSNLSRGDQRTIIGVIGDDRQVVDASEYEGLPGVAEVLRVLKPFKLASIDFQPTPTVV
ncbi:MAG TPA: 3-deoxy-7-phosphoheptulonate synthase, partial [Anaeromyxobacteraceae bacterium]